MIEEGTVIAKNKKAAYQYFLEDKWIAGIQLTGTEIKSIRNHKARITEAYCNFIKGELHVLNMYIEPYSHGGYANHEPTRVRKLLLTANELGKIKRKLRDVGNTCIPLTLFISKSGFAKLEIALATGKKLQDKREDLKKKEAKRQIDRSRSDRYE
ncbi:MAG: SsrA-binding protein SmpB [Flavobacteriales bacterium]|nr:SsrA-binding protein SmpB [Flavobacteriales bacterium]